VSPRTLQTALVVWTLVFMNCLLLSNIRKHSYYIAHLRMSEATVPLLTEHQ